MTGLSTVQVLVNELRDQGYKITAPRSQVIERLAARMEENFTAEELAADLAEVGRATVYRTIRILLEQGLICRVILSDGAVCYRMSHSAHHHHLVCTSCGGIEDVHLAEVENVLSRVREATEYQITGHRLEIYGRCPRCQ